MRVRRVDRRGSDPALRPAHRDDRHLRASDPSRRRPARGACRGRPSPSPEPARPSSYNALTTQRRTYASGSRARLTRGQSTYKRVSATWTTSWARCQSPPWRGPGEATCTDLPGRTPRTPRVSPSTCSHHQDENLPARGCTHLRPRLTRMKVAMATSAGTRPAERGLRRRRAGRGGAARRRRNPGHRGGLLATESPGTHTLSAPPCSGSCPANPDATWSRRSPTRSTRWPGSIATPATSRTPSVPRQPWRSSGTTRTAWTSSSSPTSSSSSTPPSPGRRCSPTRARSTRATTSRRALDGLTAGTPEYERAMLSATDELRARRNRPGGYWIAKDDPEAAAQAVTGSVASRAAGRRRPAQQRRQPDRRSLRPRGVAGRPGPDAHEGPGRDHPAGPRGRDRGRPAPTTRRLPSAISVGSPHDHRHPHHARADARR